MSEDSVVASPARFVPFAGNHAIVECVIALHVMKILTSRELAIIKSRLPPELRLELPNEESTKGFQFTVAGDVPGMESAGDLEIGYALKRLRPDGTPARMLRFFNNFVSVNHLAYDSWEHVVDRAMVYMRPAIGALDLENNRIEAVSLRYIDRFVFEGDISKASAAQAMLPTSEYLPAHCFKAGNNWHCHTGWFEPLSGSARDVLSQLNISSAQSGSTVSLTIDHNQVVQVSSIPSNVEDVFGAKIFGDGDLRAILNGMHDHNKACLSKVLQPSMVEVINLSGTNDAE